MAKENAKEATIRALYTELHKFNQNEEFEKAIKTINRIIGFTPDDPKPLECKVICLIHVSKFTEAINVMDRSKQLTGMVFERAYCEYRLNRPADALKTIDDAGMSPLPTSFKELRAQILYRMEKFEECFDAYRDIIKNTQDDYEDERAANLSAVAANLAMDKSTYQIPKLREDTYELSYNSACILAGQQKYSEAEKKLRVSEKMCREFLEEDGSTEDDIQDELLIMKVQVGYCLHMQGKFKEASDIYANALKIKPKDVALTAVASNNLVVINKDQNMFDSKKKMRAAMSDSCEHKLTARQKKIIALNNCLLTFYTNQGDVLRQLTDGLVRSYPDTEFIVTMIRVSQLSRDKRFKEAIEFLNKYSKTTAGNELAIKFATVQIHLLNGNKKEAIDVLQSLGESKYRPGVVSALVSLYLGTGNSEAASQVLKDAVDWYKKDKSSVGDLTDMWRQAADFHLRGGEAETAAKSLEELLKTNPKDVKILAQLVIAYAKFDRVKALEASKRLPALETFTTASEIDSLEASNWIMSTKAVKAVTRPDQSPGPPELRKKSKKNQRKRKGKLPQFYDLEAGPNPERWLPKYERAAFRRKRDRRSKDIIKGSQGTTAGNADQFDMTRTQNLQAKSVPIPATIPEAGPRQHRGKAQNKKRKGHR